MQLPAHVEMKIKQLQFELRLAKEEAAENNKAVYIYMLVSIFGWGGFIITMIIDLAQNGY